MTIKQQRQQRKLTKDINILRAKRDTLTRDIKILEAHLMAGKREKNRRHADGCIKKKKDFFPPLEKINV